METIALHTNNASHAESPDVRDVWRELQYWKNKYFELKSQVADTTANQTNPVWIKDHGVTRKVWLNDIVMLEADSNYTIIQTSGGLKILSSHTLKNWIDTIGNRHGFLRVHRSYLINTTHVVSYNIAKREIYLTDNTKVPVSRRFQFHDILSLVN